MVGWWLVVPLVGLLLVLGGWWVRFGLQNCFQLFGTTPSNLGRRWLGAGGGKLWLVGGLGSRRLGLRSENLENIHVFLGFWESRLLRDMTLLSSWTPTSGPALLQGVVPQPKNASFSLFLSIGISTSPQKFVYYVNKR